jgi:hypothetical protein
MMKAAYRGRFAGQGTGIGTFGIQAQFRGEREMDESIVHQIVDELFPYFEAADTQSAAILQFLKDKGIATDEDLAPYLKHAANGSSVRWLAARARVNFLLSSAMKAEPEEKTADFGKKPIKVNEDPHNAGPSTTKESQGKAEPNSDADSRQPPKTAGGQKPTQEENGQKEEQPKESPAKS